MGPTKYDTLKMTITKNITMKITIYIKRPKGLDRISSNNCSWPLFNFETLMCDTYRRVV